MLSVVVLVLAIAGVWAVAAIAFALLAGGIIHARDHLDAPYGGFSGPRAIPTRTRAPSAR